MLKFIYSEKATEFCEISTLLLTGTTLDKSKVEISQNFMASSEYMNFKRAKAEFLIHLDGIRSNKYQSNEPVLFLASTNLPWTLDPAIIRRYVFAKYKVEIV